jgi:hypothetical protein
MRAEIKARKASKQASASKDPEREEDVPQSDSFHPYYPYYLRKENDILPQCLGFNALCTPSTPSLSFDYVGSVGSTQCCDGMQCCFDASPRYIGDEGRLKPIKPSSNTVFLSYLHTKYVSFIPYIPSNQVYQVPQRIRSRKMPSRRPQPLQPQG